MKKPKNDIMGTADSLQIVPLENDFPGKTEAEVQQDFNQKYAEYEKAINCEKVKFTRPKLSKILDKINELEQKQLDKLVTKSNI